MIDIYEAIRKNKEEAIEILKKCKDNQIDFAKWDEEKGYWVFTLDKCEDENVERYFCEENCPWIRSDGYKEMVVSVKLSENKREIMVLSVEDTYTFDENQLEYYPLEYYPVSHYTDDISEYSIYEVIGFWNDNKGF